MAWNIYRIVSAMDIVEEFSTYIPKSFSDVPQKEKVAKAGGWPCVTSSKPLHLYVEGVVLLFGGMALQENKKAVLKQPPKNDAVLYQAAHTDFSNPTYKSLKKCELLNGLVKTFAVNIAVEDGRKFM